MLCVGRCMSAVACCMLHVVCRPLHVVCRLLHVAWRCTLHVGCRPLHVVCCMLHAVCCMLPPRAHVLEAGTHARTHARRAHEQELTLLSALPRPMSQSV